MVLRNVPSTATFEEQRVEINELAADVEALDAAALKAESDTLQTVTDRGFTTDNPIKIENNAATAFVVEDGSSNEKFVVDSVNGKVNVGSSAGGASGLYLFHNNSGATPAITLDGATGSITADGGSTFGGDISVQDSSYLRVRATGDNASTAVQLGPDGTGSFASGGIGLNADGSASFSGTVTHDFNSNFQKGIRLTDNGGHSMLDVNGTGANATAIAVYDGTGGGAYKVKIKHDGSAEFAGSVSATVGSFSGNVTSDRTSGGQTCFNGVLNGSTTSNILADGSATFSNTVTGQQTSNNALSAFEAVDTNGTRFKVTGAGVLSIYDNTLTENVTISSDGSATFAGGVQASGVNLQSSSTNSWFQTGTSIASTDYVWAAKDSSNNVWHSGLQTDGDLYLGGNLTGSNNIELSGSDGTGWFQNPNGDTTLSLGDLTNSNGRLVLTAKSNALEIHSRSNHPIEFLFNTVTKTKMTIDGGINFEASGAGIVFDWQSQASGTTSDKLDHYEEGTWTPTIDRLDTSPTTATYTYNTGKYTRIGNVVTVYFDLNISALGGGAGRFVIAGLPFNSATDSNSGGYGSPQFRNSTAFSVEAQERPSSYHSLNTINLRYVTSSNGEDDMTVGPGRITGWSVYFAS